MFAVGKKVGTGAEQIIYEHFLYVVKAEQPGRVIERFRSLFLDGLGYVDNRIWSTIETLAFEKTAEQCFPLIINRCCYILVNHWQMQTWGQEPIAELIQLLDKPKEIRTTYSRIVRRLRQLLEVYLNGEDYVKLKRLNVVLNATTAVNGKIDDLLLGRLITRYPYLYEYSLMSEERTLENVETIKRVQRNLRKKTEQNLSYYLTYQIRRSRIKSQLGRDAANHLQPFENPTLLSVKELGTAFGQFAGKAEGEATYQDLSRSFATRLQLQPTIKTFKKDLYEYIVSGVEGDYGRRSFNTRLSKTIENISPDRDSQRVDEISILRTCTHVLNHLTIESSDKPHHFVFTDMISNLGAVFSTGLLLKIVLICHKAKPLLEHRFAILFNHYESSQCKGVPWLVKSLETWNVANAIHFGKIDPSAINFLQSIGNSRSSI